MIQKLLEFLLSSKLDLTRARFGFALEQPWLGIMLSLGVILLLLGFWSYQSQSASPRKRLVMGIFRGVTLLVVVLLFCRPQVLVDEEIKTPSVVAVWIDDSLSMMLCDPYKDAAMREMLKQVAKRVTIDPGETRPSRWHLASDTLIQAGMPKDGWLTKLGQKQDVAIFTGGAHAVLLGVVHEGGKLDGVMAQLKTQKPVEESTDVPAVVQEIFRQLQGQPVSGVVLLTDGQSTERTLPAVATSLAQQYHTPIFALPVGQTDEPLNLQLGTLQLPENTFAKDPTVAKLHLKVTGITQPTPVKIRLMRKVAGGAPEPLLRDEKGSLIEYKEVIVDPAKKEMDVELIFHPALQGGQKTERIELVADADPVGDELTLKDNHAEGHTTVMDAQITVLYVEGYPRWEYRYLKAELMREKTIKVSCLLLSADTDFAQEGTIPITRFPKDEEELKKYDVILIGDVDPQFFSEPEKKLIVDFVKKSGGGVGFIAGPMFNPETYKGTPLESLLPIVPDDPITPSLAKNDNGSFNLRLTPTGKESVLFRFFDDPAKNLQQVEKDNPEMYWFKPVIGLKGAVEVLAEHPTRIYNGTPAPLIVTGRYGAGRVVFSGICDTWRWRRYLGEPLYQSYWLQMCRILYREKALGQSRRVELAADNPVVEISHSVRIVATVRDTTLLPGLPGQITLNVTDDSGRPQEPVGLSRVGANGETYQGVMTAAKLGKMKLELTPGSLADVEVTPLEITVERPRREFANATVDKETMDTMSQRTEGKVLPLTAAGELASLISDKSQLNDHPLSEELWYKPLALFLVVLLLTVEWLVRKSAGLI